MRRDHTLFLKDILDAIASIESFVGGMTLNEFLQDDKTQSAVVRKLEIIGEATKQLPEPIRQRYPDVPWSSMARMRDRLAHGYWSVDNEIVWKVVQEELPVIKPHLVAIYERERGFGEHG